MEIKPGELTVAADAGPADKPLGPSGNARLSYIPPGFK